MTAGDSATGTIEGTHLAQVNVRLRSELAPELAQAAELELLGRMQSAAAREPEAASGSAARRCSPSTRRSRSRCSPTIRGAPSPTPAACSPTCARSRASPTSSPTTSRPPRGARRLRPRAPEPPRPGVDPAGARGAAGDPGRGRHQDARRRSSARRARAAARASTVRRAEDVARVQVGVQSGVPVLLSAVATLSPRSARRRSGTSRAAAACGSGPASTAATSVASPREVREVLDRHAERRPRRPRRVSGQARARWTPRSSSLLFAAVISVFLIYVVMASSFESLHHPLLIMFTVPLALIGVSGACADHGDPDLGDGRHRRDHPRRDRRQQRDRPDQHRQLPPRAGRGRSTPR
jgi:hypothetical protein